MDNKAFKKGSIIYRIKSVYEPATQALSDNNDEIVFVLNDTNLKSYSLLTVYGKHLYKNSCAIDWAPLL
jgi:hypothetical protein